MCIFPFINSYIYILIYLLIYGLRTYVCEHKTMFLRTSTRCLRRIGTQSTSRSDIRQRAAATGVVPPATVFRLLFSTVGPLSTAAVAKPKTLGLVSEPNTIDLFQMIRFN